jgi:ferredoxin-nitrate reductase
VGGGLLGLELAASLRELNVKVTVIQRISRFMDRQLDQLGSDLLHQEIADRGIEIFYNDEVQSFYGSEKIEAVRLKSGRKIDCDVAVFAIGTSPNVELAKACGLEVNRGVVVNDYLQTSDPAIFAMGEIAQWRGEMWGITAAAEQQADVAAKYLAGDLASYYKGSLSMNILKMEGLNLCSLGMVETPNDTSYEEILFIDKSKRYYKKCIIQNDRLVGAILIGDKSEFLEFKELISNKIELSEKRLELLRSGKKAEPVIGKLVCSCNGVGEGNIQNMIAAGCKDFTELCQKTGAGMGCGSCRPEVRGILDKSKINEKVELIPNLLQQ